MVYKDSAGKEIHEGDSLMDLTPGFVGEISEVFLDEDEGELAVQSRRNDHLPVRNRYRGEQPDCQ